MTFNDFLDALIVLADFIEWSWATDMVAHMVTWLILVSWWLFSWAGG